MRANDTACLARSLNSQCRPKDHAGFLVTEEGERGKGVEEGEKHQRGRETKTRKTEVQKDGEHCRRERERQCAREVFLELNSDLFRERQTEKGVRGRDVYVCVYMYVAFINIYTHIDVYSFILMTP